MEQLLERQWEQGSQFLMEQGQHFDSEYMVCYSSGNRRQENNLQGGGGGGLYEESRESEHNLS